MAEFKAALRKNFRRKERPFLMEAFQFVTKKI